MHRRHGEASHGIEAGTNANWLENVAALTAEGAFLGATSLLDRMPEVRVCLDAVGLYLHHLAETESAGDVQLAIDRFHSAMRCRAIEAIPH
jgi:hypothetical protein